MKNDEIDHCIHTWKEWIGWKKQPSWRLTINFWRQSTYVIHIQYVNDNTVVPTKITLIILWKIYENSNEIHPLQRIQSIQYFTLQIKTSTIQTLTRYRSPLFGLHCSRSTIYSQDPYSTPEKISHRIKYRPSVLMFSFRSFVRRLLVRKLWLLTCL